VAGVCAQTNGKWIDSGMACISAKAWLGALCLYSECECDPWQYSDETCVDRKKWENLWNKLISNSSVDCVNGPVCFNFAQKATEAKTSTGTSGTTGTDETGTETDKTDDTTSTSAEEDIQPGGWISANSTACQLTGQETCNDPSGDVKYKCDKCRCNTSIYSVMVYNDGYLENCKQDSSRTADDIGKSCFYEYCIDADGIHRKPGSNIGGNGSTPLQLTQNVSCEVKSISEQWIQCKEDEAQ
jgi:hypothetical protein